MSIKSFFHNLFGVDKTNKQDAEKRVDDMVGGSYGYFGPPTPLSHEECKKCGGFFKPGSLKTITEINVVVGAKRGPTTHTIFSSFCDRCEPPSDVILNLVDGKSQDVIDYKYFIFHKFEIAEIFEDGEAVVSISMAEANAVWCQVCGDPNKATTCADCKKKAKKNG